MINLGLAFVNFILKKILKEAKVSAGWIPHLLTDEQKCTRLQMAKQLLKKYAKYQRKVFDRLITGDETLAHFMSPSGKFIMKICLYNFDHLQSHFYIVKLGFIEVYIIFLISTQNIDCRYSLEPPRRGGSNEYP